MSALHPLLSELLGPAGGAVAAPSRAAGALAYVRVSTDMQEDRGLSIPAQLKAIREYAARHDIQVLDTFTEAASSYQDESKRAEFRRMFERAKSDPQVGMMLVHESSRFCRDPWRTPQLIGELQDAGVRLVSVTEPEYDVSTVMGMWMQKITEAKNASYSMEVAFHTRKGMRENANARDPETGWCYKNGGRPPWGYRTLRKERTDVRGRPRFKAVWELNDEEVAGRPVWEWTRDVLLRAAEGASLDSLRDMLNRAGVPSPTGRAWGTSTIHSLLEPHMLLQYAGHGTWAVRMRRRVRWNPSDQWEVVENAHPGIISAEEAKGISRRRQQARAAHENASSRMARVRSSSSRFVLSGGLFTCSRCGANMTGHTDRGRDGYLCGAAKYRRGQGCGPSVFVQKDLIENAVWDTVRAWASEVSGRHARRLVKEANAELQRIWEATGGKTAEAARAELDKVDQKIGRLRTLLEDGLSDVAWANRRLVELAQQRERALGDLGQGGVAAEPPEVDMDALTGYLRDLDRLLAHATNEEKRDLARRLVDGVTLEPDRHEIEVRVKLPPDTLQRVEAATGVGPVMEVLQTSALPLGYAASREPDKLERETGFEPATLGLGSRCSTN